VSDVLEAPFRLQGREVSVRASIGIATGRVGEHHATEFLRDADVAMYTAKSRGKARYETFEPSMQAAVRARHELKADMEQAIARDELFLHFQPIVRLDTGRVTGVEALLRWDHPERGPVQPCDFVPLAEETGLILPVGRWVLEQASRQAVAWQARYPGWSELTICVNISARQIQQPTFVSEVTEVLRKTGLAPRHLILEITESAMMEDSTATLVRLEGLKELGVRLAIDDFGTGYSSLSSLRHLPVDILKLAKPFVDELAHRAEEVAFAEAILRMADSLHLEAVAEGIETREQLVRLRELGCDLGQGYHVAFPMTAAEVEGSLASLGVEQWSVADIQPRAQVIELRR
jgi:EAL domain-containing protein (putative c-di-GMP-specific phosphodiesterase class I)